MGSQIVLLHFLLSQLTGQPLGCHGVTQVQIPGIFLILEISVGVRVGQNPALLDGLGIVGEFSERAEQDSQDHIALRRSGVRCSIAGSVFRILRIFLYRMIFYPHKSQPLKN